MKQALVAISLFAAAACTWLSVMEIVLKHPGYAGRSVLDALLAIQASATVLFLLSRRPAALRIPVLLGAVAVLCFGGWAVFGIVTAQHFEGFVLVIGSVLFVEGALTLTVLGRTPHTGTY